MDFLPLFLNIRGRRCLVVGGGEIARRKAELLCRAGATVCVVAPRVDEPLRKLVMSVNGECREREFRDSDLEGAVIVVAATNERKINRLVSEAAGRAGMPVNVVDQPELCSFIFPAVIDRSPVVLAVSSSGRSPVLVRQIKEQLETMIPGAIGSLADLLGSYRDEVKQRIGGFSSRVRFWERLLDSEVSELVYSGKEDEARQLVEQRLAQSGKESDSGEVYLVGAGPGDPDLLTLRALRLMQKADVVLYDRLVSPEILARIRPDAERIHVGKQRQNHPIPQEEINDMLIRLAKAGKRVLRLKGGDPFIFGRGGEEIETLAEKGIPFQVIPGITAASGCACYAGIPLTHRDHSQSVRFLTGHLKGDRVDLNWQQLVGEKNQTLVFYMGLASLGYICAELKGHGMAAETPAALVQQGTTRNQKVVTGTLETLPALVEKSNIKAPTIIIVGDVVKLHRQFAWFQPTR